MAAKNSNVVAIDISNTRTEEETVLDGPYTYSINTRLPSVEVPESSIDASSKVQYISPEMKDVAAALRLLSKYTGASVERVGKNVEQLRKSGSSKPRGRPKDDPWVDYHKLRQIDFASMTVLDKETRPLARRLMTVDAALRKAGVSMADLGDRTQVLAAGRLASQLQRDEKKELASKPLNSPVRNASHPKRKGPRAALG
jgi:hypothetical protein